MHLFPAMASLTLIWFLMVTIPGPNFFVVTQHSVADSRKSGLLIALGVSAGAGAWATASLIGLSAVFHHATWLYDTIQIIGGMYLLFNGLKTVWAAFFPPQSLSFEAHQLPGSGFAAFRRGLLASYSNPKTAAFFGSLFVATFPQHAPGWIYFVTVGIVVCISMIWYGLVACVFSTSVVQRAYRRLKPIFDFIAGSLLSFLGLRLAFARS